MVLRFGQDIGFVNRDAIDRNRIENRARLGRHARIGFLIGGVAGLVLVAVMSGGVIPRRLS
ncbi:hypothetical protein H711_02976, partial [Brucella ovis IntaBari-2009-88-3]